MSGLVGRCLCGGVTVTVDGAHVPAVGACHCAMCRRWGDGVYVDFRAEAAAVSVEGPLRRFASSAFAERAFCDTCGSHLWFRKTGDADAPYLLMPGLFEAARSWPLKDEGYSDRAPAYARLAGNHPRTTRAAFEARSEHVEGD